MEIAYVAAACLWLPWFKWLQQNQGRNYPFIGISFLYVIWVLVNGDFPPLDGVTAATAALAIWLIASMIWTDSPASLHELLFWLSCLILFTAARSVPVNLILWAVLAVGAILAGLQFHKQFIEKVTHEQKQLPVFGNSNHNSIVMIMGMLSGLWLAHDIGSWVLFIVSLFIGIAIWFTMCRAGILAAYVGLFVASFGMPWWFPVSILAATAVVIAGILLLWPLCRKKVFRPDLGVRPAFYYSAWLLIKRRPWFGLGLRMYQKLSAETFYILRTNEFLSKFGWEQAASHRVHNDILEMILEIGVFGFALFAFIFSYIEFNAFSLAVLVAFLTHGMFFFPMREVHTAVPFWAIMGAVAGFGAPAGTWIITVALVMVCVMVILETVKKVFGLIYFAGSGGERTDAERRKMLIKAVQMDPYNTEYLSTLSYHCKDEWPVDSMQCLMVALSNHDGAMRLSHDWQSFAATLFNNDKRLFIEWALKRSAHYQAERVVKNG